MASLKIREKEYCIILEKEIRWNTANRSQNRSTERFQNRSIERFHMLKTLSLSLFSKNRSLTERS